MQPILQQLYKWNSASYLTLMRQNTARSASAIKFQPADFVVDALWLQEMIFRFMHAYKLRHRVVISWYFCEKLKELLSQYDLRGHHIERQVTSITWFEPFCIWLSFFQNKIDVSWFHEVLSLCVTCFNILLASSSWELFELGSTNNTNAKYKISR